MLSFSDLKTKVLNYYKDDAHFIGRTIRDFTLGRVGLYRLTYDSETQEYRQTYVHVKRSALPPEAVHISGKNGHEYIIDEVDTGNYPKPGYTNATDLYLYMMNNDISEALTNVRKPLNIDTRYLLYIGAAVVGVALLYASGLVQI